MSFLRSYFQGVNVPKLLYAFALFSLLLAEPSFAQSFEGINSFLTRIVQGITGDIGKTCAAIAVMAVGGFFMTGRMDWTFAISIIMGIAVIFGAAGFVKSISVAGL